jgi:hypothetical protein
MTNTLAYFAATSVTDVLQGLLLVAVVGSVEISEKKFENEGWIVVGKSGR